MPLFNNSSYNVHSLGVELVDNILVALGLSLYLYCCFVLNSGSLNEYKEIGSSRVCIFVAERAHSKIFQQHRSFRWKVTSNTLSKCWIPILQAYLINKTYPLGWFRQDVGERARFQSFGLYCDPHACFDQLSPTLWNHLTSENQSRQSPPIWPTQTPSAPRRSYSLHQGPT